MPKSKTDAPKAKPSDAPAAAQDPSREDSGVAEVANQEPSDQEPGIHGLSDSMERLLLEAGRQAGVTREQIIARYGRVDLKNYNEVRADLKDMAEAK
jgi:hypothetical protein